MNKVIVSVLGHDRPGIVAAVTRILFEYNCNIENVSQTILKTEFAGSFIISIPPDLTREELRQALKESLASMNMHIHIESVLDHKSGLVAGNAEPFVITTKGPDRKGLVASISALIAHYGVNITNLQAVFKGGDDPDNNIMIYEVDIPVQQYYDLRSGYTGRY
jgi:glycine cleavage system transcriptional repressor